MNLNSNTYIILRLMLKKNPNLSSGQAGAIVSNIKSALKGL